MNEELLVVGAGPAGVAAALMAASLGMRCTVVEAEQVASKVRAIGALRNVPGNWARGSELADALTADLAGLQTDGRCSLIRARAAGVAAYDDRVEVVLEDGGSITAGAAVVATGVAALAADDAGWITAAPELRLAPLWRATAEEMTSGRRVAVLGGDRPLGTWLRTHPDVAVRPEVFYPEADAYKIAEVRDDPRVLLHPVEHVTIDLSAQGFRLEVQRAGGAVDAVVADLVLGNLGSRPAVPAGDLKADPDGYCPPGWQHPRILTAGDLRSARFQRIVTAQGAGASAVLSRYYDEQRVVPTAPAVSRPSRLGGTRS